VFGGVDVRGFSPFSSDYPREDGETFPDKPRLRHSIGDDISNDKLRKYLANQGRQTLIFEILGRQKNSQNALD
jgi:hypothetical protein